MPRFSAHQISPDAIQKAAIRAVLVVIAACVCSLVLLLLLLLLRSSCRLARVPPACQHAADCPELSRGRDARGQNT